MRRQAGTQRPERRNVTPSLGAPPSFGGGGGSPPAPPFSPEDIAGLVGWFDMQDTGAYTESGGTITGVTNKVSSVVWDTGTLPTFEADVVNGLPGMVFDGTQGILSTEAAALALFIDGAAFTVYIVGHTNVPDSTDVGFGFGNSAQATASSGGIGCGTAGAGVWAMYHRNAANTTNNDFSAGANTSDDVVLAYIHSATTISISVNNAALDPDGASATYGVTTPDRMAIGLNPRSTPAQQLIGAVGEILLYNTAHDATQRGQVAAYLGTKWGIAVA